MKLNARQIYCKNRRKTWIIAASPYLIKAIYDSSNGGGTFFCSHLHYSRVFIVTALEKKLCFSLLVWVVMFLDFFQVVPLSGGGTNGSCPGWVGSEAIRQALVWNQLLCNWVHVWDRTFPQSPVGFSTPWLSPFSPQWSPWSCWCWGQGCCLSTVPLQWCHLQTSPPCLWGEWRSSHEWTRWRGPGWAHTPAGCLCSPLVWTMCESQLSPLEACGYSSAIQNQSKNPILKLRYCEIFLIDETFVSFEQLHS